MNAKVFVDTNIFVYAKLESPKHSDKSKKARIFLKSLNDDVMVSTQVLNEFANVLLRHKVKDKEVYRCVQEIIRGATVQPVDLPTIERAWRIKEKFKFSYWDSVIIASAQESY